VPSRLLTLLLCLPLGIATADTVKLKSGEVIIGHITSTDKESLTVEVQYSPTISDIRTLPRADVAYFAVDAGDEAAFAKIRDLKTPDTAIGPKSSQQLLDEQLLPFLKKYPSSPRVPDVELKIRDLRADISRLKAGDVKVAGVWYDKDDFAAEKYQIEAAAVLDAMRTNYDAKDLPATMNSFVLLRRSYPNSLAYVEGLQLAPQALARLQQRLNLEITNLPETKALRQAAIDRTPVEERQPIKQAIAIENARAAATAALAQKKQQPFYTIFSFDEKGLKAMQAAAAQIEKELAAVDVKSLEQGARLVRRAAEEADSHHLAAAQTTLAQLKETWSAYEGLPRIERRIANAVEADKASAEAAALAGGKKKP